MQSGSQLVMFLPLVAIIVIMYFITIRPQNKQRKEAQDMRSSLAPGDDVVTIGGICGRVTKVKEDSIIIAVGADRVKFEMKKWAIKEVTKAEERRAMRTGASVDENLEEPEKKKSKLLPKRMDQNDNE